MNIHKGQGGHIATNGVMAGFLRSFLCNNTLKSYVQHSFFMYKQILLICFYKRKIDRKFFPQAHYLYMPLLTFSQSAHKIFILDSEPWRLPTVVLRFPGACLPFPSRNNPPPLLNLFAINPIAALYPKYAYIRNETII